MLDNFFPFAVLSFLLIISRKFAVWELDLGADDGPYGVFGLKFDVVEAHVDCLEFEVLNDADGDVEHLFVDQLAVGNVKVAKLCMVDDHSAHVRAKVATVVFEGAVR